MNLMLWSLEGLGAMMFVADLSWMAFTSLLLDYYIQNRLQQLLGWGGSLYGSATHPAALELLLRAKLPAHTQPAKQH
jgi:hypothetical protein